MNKIQTFNPQGKNFCFRMDKFDCFYCKTGKCSLELSEEETLQNLQEEGIEIEDEYYRCSDNSVLYCRLLSQSIQKKGYLNGIMIYSNSCGHFSFNNGQHRTCIGKKTGLTAIPIEEAGDNGDLCDHCYNKRRNIKYRIEAFLNKSHWFIG